MDTRTQTPSPLTERRARTLDHLLRTHHNQLIRQAGFHARNPEEADDALADACVQFMRFWNDPPGVEVLPWFLVVIKRCAWAISRKERLRESRHQAEARERVGEQLACVVREAGPGPAELAERAEDTTETVKRIESLKADERTALILLGLGASYAEIGELREWSQTKVNRCIAEGRQAMRAQLEAGER